MSKRIVIAGTGFAGTWSAISAARAASLAGMEDEVEITIVSPTPHLHIRPRLYESILDGMAPDLLPLFAAIGVRHLAGTVERVHAERHEVEVERTDGRARALPYDRFILAAGSQLFMPAVPGLKEHGFNVDQLAGAEALDAHLKALAGRPATAARNTVVVAGAGFTGLETATEMPERLRAILGQDTAIRVVLLEQAPVRRPRPRPGAAAGDRAGAGRVRRGGDHLRGCRGHRRRGCDHLDRSADPSNTVIWTAGMRANPLAAQIEGEHDRFGRVHADPHLHAKGSRDIFVTGDVALAATDDQGHVASMSCQHALSLGRVAGHNAAAELVGLPLHPYSQPKYVTCLDLGPWGAIFTEGWDRQVKLTREVGKATKREINTKWIYPPEPNREAAFALARPDHVIVA